MISAGTFYPRGATSAEARLRFYSSVFPIVEVDSTYYALPSKQNSELWVERTPNGFVFDIKAFRLMTLHWTESKVLPRDLQPLAPSGKGRFYWKDTSPELRDAITERFVDALSPLQEADKLGLVLLQFPSWIGPRTEVEEHILAMKDALREYRIAVEFRNKYWLQGDRVERTLGWLRRHHLAFVVVDEPQGFKSSVPPVVDITAEDAYLRFHGQNAETWEAPAKTSAERFDWRYSPQELEEWVPKIEFMAEHASRVHVLFNTNNSDQGPYNAMMIGHLLQRGLGQDRGVISEVQERLGSPA